MSEKQKKKIKSLKKELKALKSQMKKLKLGSAAEKKSKAVKAAPKTPTPIAPTLAPKADKPAESPRDAKTLAARIGGQH
jgi:hypothetical protein